MINRSHKIKQNKDVDMHQYNDLVMKFDALLQQEHSKQIQLVYNFLKRNKEVFIHDTEIFQDRLVKKLEQASLTKEEMEYVLNKFNQD